MTVKDLYGKIKKKSLIQSEDFLYLLSFLLALTISIGIMALYVLIVQILWNWIAPTIGLVKLSFLKTGGLILLIKLMTSSIGINTKRISNDTGYKQVN